MQNHNKTVTTKTTFRALAGLFAPLIVFFLLTTLVLSGCGSAVYKQNPALQTESDAAAASVYFIRPAPVKYKGVADNPVKISYDGQELLKIPEGTYTLLKIKQGKGEVTTHSKTRFTNRLYPIDVSRSRVYTFVAGRTYFIHIKRVNDEFRGITYDPEPVDLATAKTLSEKLSKWGLANRHPIEDIEEVPPVPDSSPLEPMYPEQVYPGTPYLLKKPIPQ